MLRLVVTSCLIVGDVGDRLAHTSVPGNRNFSTHTKRQGINRLVMSSIGKTLK